MNLIPTGNSINPHYEECMRLHKCWCWFLVLGGLIAIVGLSAIGSAFIATLASVLLFGWLLIAGGIAQLVNAFLGRSWRAFFIYLLGAIIHLVVGLLLIEHPLAAAAGITLAIAAGFFVGGILRMIYGVIESFPGRIWVILHGLVSFALGVAIWRQWPGSTAWVIGLFVGIDLLFNGISWIMLGLLLKTMKPEPTAGQAPAAPRTQDPAVV